MANRPYSKQGSSAGVYHMRTDRKINARAYWVKNNGIKAVWYNAKWYVGRIEDLGSTTSHLKSESNASCPHQSTMSWDWANWTGTWAAAGKNVKVKPWTYRLAFECPSKLKVEV